MYGVKFGNLHSWHDFQLLLTDKEIGTPAPKTALIDIPGGDGALDLTEAFGPVRYENRKLSFDFSTIVPMAQFMEQFAKVQNALHGQKMEIALDADPGWFYVGRVSVNTWKADRRVGKITIDCDCEPYKNRWTAQTVSLAGRNLIDLDSGTATIPEAWTKTATGYSFTRGETPGGTFVHFSVPVEKGREYIFSADYSGTSRLLYVYKDRLYGDQVAKTDNGQPCVFTPDSTGVYIFGLYCTSGAADGVFTNVMLQSADTAAAYTAYDRTEKTLAATFWNTRKSAVPTIYASGELTVESPSTFITLNPGENILPEFVFGQGDNTLTFKGQGVAVVEWKEGGL